MHGALSKLAPSIVVSALAFYEAGSTQTTGIVRCCVLAVNGHAAAHLPGLRPHDLPPGRAYILARFNRYVTDGQITLATGRRYALSMGLNITERTDRG